MQLESDLDQLLLVPDGHAVETAGGFAPAKSTSTFAKCDLQYPTCGACSAAKVECWGFDTTQGLDKPRSIVRHLEDEVAQLEIELAALKSQTNSSTKILDDTVHRLTDSLALALANPTGRNVNQSKPLPLVSKYFLSESPLPHVHNHDLDGSSARFGEVSRPRAVDITSINRNVVEAMLKHYCGTYRPQYPALAEEDLYKARDKVYENPALIGYDAFIVYLTLAISSNTLAHIDGKRAATTTNGLWEMAVAQLEYVGLTDSFERLQALELLAHYGFLNPQHVNVGHCAATATRLAFQLGIHEELPFSQQGPAPAVLNSRRRIFWNAYAIDAAVHSVRNQPFRWRRPGVTIQLPDTESQTQPTHSAHVWTLREIESDITMGLSYNLLAAERSGDSASFGVWQKEVGARLDHWYQKIRQSVNLTEKIEFHELLYQIQVLRLNKPSPRCPVQTPEMRKRAMKASIDLIREFSITDRLGKMFMLWHAAHCLVEAGLYLLLSIVADMRTSISHSRQLGGEDASIMARYIKILPGLTWKVASRWPSMSWYASTLDSLSAEVAESIQQWMDDDDSWRPKSDEVEAKLERYFTIFPVPVQTRTESDARYAEGNRVQNSGLDIQFHHPFDVSQPEPNLQAQATIEEVSPVNPGHIAVQPGVTGTVPILQDSFDFGDMMAWDFSGIDSEDIFAAFLEEAQSESFMS